MENNLVEIRHTGELTFENTDIEFEMDYDFYSITGVAVCDIEVNQEAEPEVGFKRTYQLNGVDFMSFVVKSEANDVVLLGNGERARVKQDIENYFDNLTQEL